ncbi:MAG TPA: hypothetical protein VF266_25040 [Thermoanaerobaculia bacterium]
MSKLWRAVKRFYIFILPIRFSLLALLVIVLALLVSDQGRDVMRALAEDRVGAWWLRVIMLVVATNLLAYAIWFWSRHLLRYRPHSSEVCDPSHGLLEEFPKWTKWLPRILGLLAFLAVIAAFPAAVGVTFRAQIPALMWWIMAWLILSAIVYWLFVVKRPGGKIGAKRYTAVSAWKDLDPITRRVLLISFVLEVALFLWALLAPVTWWVLGVAAALVLTIAVWIPLGSYIVAVGEAYRVPILTFILALGLLLSPLSCVDNHEIRTLGRVAERTTIDEAFRKWHSRVAARPEHAGRGTIPMVIVATEGGGIRAAYWTAAVLSSLQDQLPGFADHCFAISGVSGGSVGAAVFESLLVRRAVTPSAGLLHADARGVLEFDALSGTLAALSQPDLLQRFIPLNFPDRAKALERGWEYGWEQHFTSETNVMAQPFVQTLQKHPTLPVLLMNGTLIETGDRIITSNVALRPNPHFRNAFDSFDAMGRDVRTSTAALLSARFPYVTPVGTIVDMVRGGKRRRIADGGYFEVSGAVTAAEVADFVMRQNVTPKVQPLIVLIDYRDEIDEDRRDPRNPLPFCPAPAACGPSSKKDKTFFATEIWSPIAGLLSARGARGSQAVGDVVQLMGDAHIAEFRLLPRYVPLPLGWVLSQRAQDSIDWSAACEGGNRSATDRVAAHIGVRLRPGWMNAQSNKARQAMNAYVPNGVPCEGGGVISSSCASEGCDPADADPGTGALR